EPRQHLVECRLLLVAQLVHQRPAAAGDERDLGGAGGAMAEAVGAFVVDVEGVMGVLDGGDPVAAAGQLGDQPLDQRGLAGVLPARHPKDGTLRRAHRWLSRNRRSAVASSSGVLTL